MEAGYDRGEADERRGLARVDAPTNVERARREGGSNSVVESQPSKLLVAGSIPVSRSMDSPAGYEGTSADVAQLAERVLGKDEVTGSIPVIGSIGGKRVKGLRTFDFPCSTFESNSQP